jgi:hypothetical protein
MARINDILNGIKQSFQNTKAENENTYPENQYEENIISLSENQMDEYKQSYYDMSVGSLRAIMNHAHEILENLDNQMVKENLTAPHLQGIIAVAEDHMRGIHDFVMYVETDDDDSDTEQDAESDELNPNRKRKKVKISDLTHYEYQYKKYPGVTTTPDSILAAERPGLWENIRKKKDREGKKYRPAKPGDPDRPDTKQWKKLTKPAKE